MKLMKSRYKQIIDDYNSGLTQLETGKRNSVGRDTVGNILKRFGAARRPYTGERNSKLKWTWDRDFFDKRNPTVAYWAGFLMADGSLASAGKATLALVLQEKDKEHVLSFCRAIDLSEEAIYHIEHGGCKQTTQWGLHLHHKDLQKQLLPWGIVPRKTYVYSEPQVPDDLLPHYLRGWADGDGSIYIRGTGARFTITGNTEAMKWYGNALRKLGYTGNFSAKRKGEYHSELYIGGTNQVEHLARLLLTEGSFKLERKWNVTYNSKKVLYPHICKVCGQSFGVEKYRHESEPQNGKFCSRKCFATSMRKQAVDGRMQCCKCEQMVLSEEMSANDSYCKLCWREIGRAYYQKKHDAKKE